MAPETEAATGVVSKSADVVIQKTDEQLNRGAYKEELIATANKQCEKMPKAIRSSTRAADVG